MDNTLFMGQINIQTIKLLKLFDCQHVIVKILTNLFVTKQIIS